jgi:hypothetical protein
MAKGKKRELWVIEYTGMDPSRDATVAYRSREEAVGAAADFIREAANYWLEALEWDPADKAPEMLKEILRDLDEGKVDNAIMGWLDYQGEYDPDDRIAIGPSGSVSQSPHDFAYIRS